MRRSIHHDQHGLGVVVIVLVIIVIAAIGGGGYYIMSKNKDKAADANLSASSKAIETECKKQMDDKDFCKFASNFTLDSSYKVVMSYTGSTGSGSTTSEINGKNSRTTTSQGGKEISATVMIDGTMYSKDISDGVWIKYPPSTTEPDKSTPTEPDFNFDTSTTEDTTANTTEYKKISKEACGTLTCFKYQVIDKTATNDEQFIWFDDQDYKLRHWTAKTADGTTDMVYSYEAVSITAPTPVKDAPNYQSMSPEELQQALDAAMQQAGQ